jgi:hypothetical protein
MGTLTFVRVRLRNQEKTWTQLRSPDLKAIVRICGGLCVAWSKNVVVVWLWHMVRRWFVPLSRLSRDFKRLVIILVSIGEF